MSEKKLESEKYKPLEISLSPEVYKKLVILTSGFSGNKSATISKALEMFFFSEVEINKIFLK